MPNFRVIAGGAPPSAVLLVEDEAVIRLAMATHLEDRGFVVREADSADAAIAILQEPDCAIDLVFSDVRMPGSLDGIALSQWIFQHRPGIAVILASGDLGKSAADLHGAQAIPKPYDFDAAADTIRRAIDDKKPLRL